MEEIDRLLSTIELDEYTIKDTPETSCSLCTPSLSSEHDAEKEVQNGWETTEKRLGGPKAAGEEVFTKLRRLGTARIMTVVAFHRALYQERTSKDAGDAHTIQHRLASLVGVAAIPGAAEACPEALGVHRPAPHECGHHHGRRRDLPQHPV